MRHFLKQRILSFTYAFQGIRTLFKDTPNSLVHLVLTILAIVLGFMMHVSETEWLAICIVIGLVFALEIVNSAIENLSDYASKKKPSSMIKRVKDLTAAAVLFAALTALAVGIIIFLPKIIDLVK